ncbi:MAG: BatA domain-containing protein, partial [Planctomycetota bacterium]
MQLLNPLFLLGAAAVAAPIIIHLLNRQRFKRVEWAAMRFVLEAIKRTHRRLRLEELILLALRCLAILLLVLALARPYLSGSFLGLAGEGDQYTIIALDGSYSMQSRVGHRTVFERAKEEAVGILDGLDRGDKLSIVLLTHAPHALQADPTVRFDEAKTELRALKPAHGGARLDQGLEVLERLVKAAPLRTVRLYVITDNQRRFWENLSKDSGLERRQVLRRLGRKTQMFVIDVGEEVGPNLTIAKFRTASPVVTKSFPVRFQADVKNYGNEAITGAEIAFYIDDTLQQTVTLNVRPGESQSISFEKRFDTTGPSAVRAELSADTLDLDNRRYLALNVEEGVRVLVVDPRVHQGLNSESLFLRFALNPQFLDGKNETSPVMITETTPQQIGSYDLDPFRVIFLTNVADIGQMAADRLKSYVENGGGLVLFLGDATAPGVYNKFCYQNGEGFLPAALTGRQGDPSRKKFLRVLAEDIDHVVLRELESNECDLSNLFVYQYVTVREQDMPEDSIVLARYSADAGETLQGAPAVIERAVGKGRVVMV